MNIGWGTTKVGVSMAFGQFFFELAKTYLLKGNDLYLENKKRIKE
jgi:hypothetical protein